MKIWSKGLGSMTLKMDFRNYYAEIDKSNGDLLIKGKITEPVLWNFVITIRKEDIPGFANILFKPNTLKYFVKNVPGIASFFVDKMLHKEKFKHPEKNIEIVKTVN